MWYTKPLRLTSMAYTNVCESVGVSCVWCAMTLITHGACTHWRQFCFYCCNGEILQGLSSPVYQPLSDLLSLRRFCLVYPETTTVSIGRMFSVQSTNSTGGFVCMTKIECPWQFVRKISSPDCLFLNDLRKRLRVHPYVSVSEKEPNSTQSPRT